MTSNGNASTKNELTAFIIIFMYRFKRAQMKTSWFIGSKFMHRLQLKKNEKTVSERAMIL